MDVKVEAIKPEMGAVVHASRENFKDPEFAQMCVDLLDKHGALVFPQVGLSDDEQVAFTDLLGDRINFTNTIPGGDVSAQDVYTITLDPTVNHEPEYVLGSMFWHGDGICSDIPPPKYTLLSCKVPPEQDGETDFCNTVNAWKALPEDEKARLRGLRVKHSVVAAVREVAPKEQLDPKRREMAHEHPLIWKQQSGRETLLIGWTADEIVGMDKPQARALLTRLQEWAAQPRFSCTHTWSKGDFAIWDNTGTLHRARPYANSSKRRMHRTSVGGVEAIA